MVINFITTRKWMVDEQFTVAEMVDQILIRYSALDPRRKYMFIQWLHDHSSRLKNAPDVFQGLTAWLETLQPESIQWEYRLIMDEIAWWSNLDEQSLTKMMLANLIRNGTC